MHYNKRSSKHQWKDSKIVKEYVLNVPKIIHKQYRRSIFYYHSCTFYYVLKRKVFMLSRRTKGMNKFILRLHNKPCNRFVNWFIYHQVQLSHTVYLCPVLARLVTDIGYLMCQLHNHRKIFNTKSCCKSDNGKNHALEMKCMKIFYTNIDHYIQPFLQHLVAVALLVISTPAAKPSKILLRLNKYTPTCLPECIRLRRKTGVLPVVIQTPANVFAYTSFSSTSPAPFSCTYIPPC
ncbi:hypothetical protein AGLY_014949 [Aphis glycines]|uniref:Uncharacterized protein n=1 Tax=Aphis glycines TaxID=307491 RepID=A0A6G0T2U1_APHGL|nr:hypothetical protein AGLY_014949 [Aphis glycines]